MPPPNQVMFSTMNKFSAGMVFLICLFLGIVLDSVALGIIAGLLLGAAAGTATKRRKSDAS